MSHFKSSICSFGNMFIIILSRTNRLSNNIHNFAVRCSSTHDCDNYWIFTYLSFWLFKTEHDLSNPADLWPQLKHRLRLCSSLCMTTVSWLRQLIRSPPRNNLHTERTCLSFRVPRSVRKWDSGGNFSFLSVTGGIIGFQSQSFHWRSRCFLGPRFS